MSTYNIRFYAELMKIILELSSNTLLICSGRTLVNKDNLLSLYFLRSWVSVSQCFLLSENIPTSLQKGKRNAGLDTAMEELNLHIEKIR